MAHTVVSKVNFIQLVKTEEQNLLLATAGEGRQGLRLVLQKVIALGLGFRSASLCKL